MTYKYDVIPLTEGLDFNTATSLSKPGSLRDCMNYEFVDGAGLRRINGYRPYDGTNLSPQDKLFFIKYTGTISTNAVFDLFPWLYVFDSVENPNNVPFGYVVNTSSTLPSHTVGPTTYTLVPFVKINCPRYADPFMRPNSIAKLLNSAALNISYDTSDILSPAELSDADYNAVFGTTTKSALTELEFLKGTGLSQERSNNHIATGYNGAGSAHDDGPGKFSAVAEMWCEEKDGVTYSIGDALRVAGLANGITIYPGDYAFLRLNPTNYLNPWLVLNVQADAGFGAGETVVLNVVPMLGHVMETGDDAYKEAWSPFYNSVDGDAEGTSLRLYRNPGSDALTSTSWFYRWGEVDLEYGPDVAVVWTRHSEEGALTAGDVYCTNSINISGGSSHTLAWATGAAASLEYTDANGSAEYMPLLASGVIKAVIPTRAGSGYSGTGTVTYDNNGTGSGGANTTYRSNCIERIYPRFHHTGWIIPFDTGNKASGFLTKINRFKDNSDVVYDDDTITGKTCTQYIHNIQNSTVPYSGTSNSARIFNDQWKTTSGSATDSASIVSAISANDGTTITNSYDWGRFSTSSVAYTSTSGFIGFSGLAGTIPEDSTIRGIAVTARVEVTASTNSSTIYTDGGATIRASLFKNSGAVQLGNPLEMLSASGSLKDTWNAATMAETVFTAGSSTNSWGNTPLKLEDLLDPTFGVSFDIRLDRNDSTVNPTGTFVIDHVTLEVTYEIPSVRLYFADANTGASGAYAGHTVISGDLLDYVVSKGSFENGDAEGYFTVVNLRTLHGTGTNPYYSVLNNYYVYNNPTLTNQIALTSGNMEFNGLDSYRTIKAADTLYTCHRANLYSNADYDTFFICSGAGRARQFDGKYLSKIYAISPSQENSEALDKPRHACTKNFSLFLGYESGQVLFSAPGDPGNFSAFDGAGEIGIGDNVVGLQNMPGNSLCVACRNSMHAIVGTSAQDYSLQTLVADEGAYEYSVVPIGGQILYVTNGGVKTLDQSEKYGNFVPRPLSFKINPWLLPRMSSAHTAFRTPSHEIPPVDGGLSFVRAHAVPYKNQYRMYFRDGTQLWMTLLGDRTEFTFVKYHYLDITGPKSFLEWRHAGGVCPLYVTTTVEKAQHLPHKTLMCFDPEVVARGVGYDYGVATGLYIADVGDFFCTQGVTVKKARIPFYFTVNYNYLQNPFLNKTIRKVRLEGQSSGQARFEVFCKDGYLTGSSQLYSDTGTPLDMPSTALEEITNSPLPQSSIANVAATGRVISVLVVGESNSPTLAIAEPVYSQPSHLAQALFVQYEEGKEDA